MIDFHIAFLLTSDVKKKGTVIASLQK